MNNSISLNISNNTEIINIYNTSTILSVSEYTEVINIYNTSTILSISEYVDNINVEVKSYTNLWIAFQILLDFLDRSGVGDIFNIG